MRASLPIAALAAVVILGFHAQGEPPAAEKEIQQLEARIDQIEVETLARLQRGPRDFSEKIELLGKTSVQTARRNFTISPGHSIAKVVRRADPHRAAGVVRSRAY